jgi:hypothetical protein
MSTINILSLIFSVLFAVGTATGFYFGFIIKLEREVAESKAEHAQQQKQLDLLPIMQADLLSIKAEQQLFWKILGPPLAGIIHSPTHKTRDELVDMLIAETITPQQACQLEGLLAEMVQQESDNNKKIAAAMLLVRAHSVAVRPEPTQGEVHGHPGTSS